MGTDNNVYGNFLFPSLPFTGLGAGIRTPQATILSPTARVAAYVRSGGPVDGDDEAIARMIVTTLDAALKRCRSGYGDVVYVLPGHSESVADATMLDNLVNGTRIIGVGDPFQDDAPTFTWTATSSKWVIDNKNVSIQGLRLNMTSINAVVEGIETSAAGISLLGNYILNADTSIATTLTIDVAAASHDLRIIGNRIYGLTGQSCGGCIKISGVSKNILIMGNDIDCACTETGTVGNINIAAAATNLRIVGNMLQNTVASSTTNIYCDNVASTGVIAMNMCAMLNNATNAYTQGVVFNSTGSLIRCFENYSCDVKGTSGILSPAATT